MGTIGRLTLSNNKNRSTLAVSILALLLSAQGIAAQEAPSDSASPPETSAPSEPSTTSDQSNQDDTSPPADSSNLPPVTIETSPETEDDDAEAAPAPDADLAEQPAQQPSQQPAQQAASSAAPSSAGSTPPPEIYEDADFEQQPSGLSYGAGLPFDGERSAPPGALGTGTTGVDGYTARGTSTATKTNTLIKDIPQSISVVTRQEADDRGSQSLGEALIYVPGVTVAQGEGHRDQINLRGQSTTADFFVDGIRDDIQYYRDIYNVDTIEVLKGASALAFGRGGGGGIINRVTKQANGEKVRDATVSFGSYDKKRTTIDIGDSFSSSAAFRFNAMYEDSESFRDYFELEKFGINPKFAFDLSDRTKLTISYEYYSDNRVVDRGVPSFNGRPLTGAQETFFGNPDVNYSDFSGHTASATLEHKFESGLNFRNVAFYANYDKIYQNTQPIGPVTGGTVEIGGYVNGTLRETFINQSDISYKYDMGNGIRHTFAAGTEFVYQDTSNSRNTPNFGTPNSGNDSIFVPVGNPTTFTPVFFNDPTRRRFTEVKTASFYFQDQLEITKYFELIGGMRFDRFDVDFHNRLNDTRLSRVDEVWSPRVGAVFKPTDTLSLYISRSESFLPGAGDQFDNLSTVDGETLEPEHFENREIGFKWEIAPRLFFTGAIFDLKRSNQIVTDGPFDGQQVGLTRTKGGELALTGYLTEDWQVSAGWGHQIAKVEEGNPGNIGKEVPFVPHNVYSLWNRYQLTSMLGLGLGVIHQDSQFASLNNTVELPSFTRVDAAVFFDINENWSAQLNVENILDEDYFASAHNNNNISPGAPRSAYVTVKASF